MSRTGALPRQTSYGRVTGTAPRNPRNNEKNMPVASMNEAKSDNESAKEIAEARSHIQALRSTVSKGRMLTVNVNHNVSSGNIGVSAATATSTVGRTIPTSGSTGVSAGVTKTTPHLSSGSRIVSPIPEENNSPQGAPSGLSSVPRSGSVPRNTISPTVTSRTTTPSASAPTTPSSVTPRSASSTSPSSPATTQRTTVTSTTSTTATSTTPAATSSATSSATSASTTPKTNSSPTSVPASTSSGAIARPTQTQQTVTVARAPHGMHKAPSLRNTAYETTNTAANEVTPSDSIAKKSSTNTFSASSTSLISGLNFEIEKLKSELEDLQAKFKKKTEECTNLKETEHRLENEVNKWKVQLKEQIAERDKNAIVNQMNEAEDLRMWKKKHLVLQKRLQSVEANNELLLQRMQIAEEESYEKSRVLEMAELSYQLLQSKSERLSEEVEFYKAELKNQEDHFSKVLENQSKIKDEDMEEQNKILANEVATLKSLLEEEKKDKATMADEMKHKISSLEKDQVERIAELLEKLRKSSEIEDVTNMRLEIASKNSRILALEQEIRQFQAQTHILAEQLNSVCDEVERSEQLYQKIELLSTENQNLKQEVAFHTNDILALKQDLINKEQEITIVMDDNEKLVTKLGQLGVTVFVDEKTGTLSFFDMNVQSTPRTPTVVKTTEKTPEAPAATAGAAKGPTATTTAGAAKGPSGIRDDLKGLTVDELLNGL
eukprot:TRINITY_DN2291_c0_g1_i5.p1 TRINITY_DN2291_c0_g1~~TRINITY_DN2291_c0_g1_i5.p1  ORF type:complete len:720 (-),score=202.93 TRINITY_DN2291_c0_g1_i5:35-2194(-)